MLHFIQQNWFGIFVIVAALDWFFSLDDGKLERRAERQAEDDEWFIHPMNKDGMNYKGKP